MEFKLNHTVAGKLREIADLLEQQGAKRFHTAWAVSGREHTRNQSWPILGRRSLGISSRSIRSSIERAWPGLRLIN